MKSQIQRQLALIPFLFGLLLAACMSTAVLAQTQIGADIDGEAALDRFGSSVSLSADGNRLAIGAPLNDGNGDSSGHVRVYDWVGSAWVQAGADIDGEAAGDRSGYPVSLSSDGERLAIGAGRNDGNGVDSGHVRVYRWTDSEWSQLGADIDGEAADDHCGNVWLSADGNRLAIGAHGNDGNGDYSGHVRVFQWSSIAWEQLGASIEGEAAGDLSGYRVSLSADGNRLAIGAHRNGGNGEDSGQVRVFQWNGSSWLQLGADIDGEAAGGNFGYSVSLSAEGGRLAAGAWNNSPGYVGVWDWTGTDWLQVGDNIYGKAEGGQFGTSVALSAGGNRLAIGAGGNSDSGYHASGQVQVYQWSGGVWTQLGNNINGIAEWDFLDAVAISSDGNTLAAGASEGDPDGTGAGRVSIYDFSMFNTFRINAGLNDAWYNPDTDGQGFFITIFPDLGAGTLAWFTYDTELPPMGATANLGDPGHRWLTAAGPIVDNQVLMEVELTSGGLFDTSTEITRTDPPGSDGTIILTFEGCNSATIEYDIPSINQQGIVPIRRVANDNIVICEALSTD